MTIPDVDTSAVLVVDDDAAILKLIGRQLADLPCLIIPTGSSAEALHILKNREIAVLLCDMNMPHISGNEVLTKARESNPNIVSILITGVADVTATIKAINEGGIWKYVPKPWKAEELVQVVSEALVRYEAQKHQQAQLTQLAADIATRKISEDEDTRPAKPEPPPPRPVSTVKAPGGFRSQRYHLEEAIGQGGMGTVFKATDLLLNMPVAIKVLHEKFTRDEEAIATLKEEARIAMQLSHRHIVRLHNLQKTGDHYFLVMEYVHGRTFREILNMYGKLPLDTILQVARVSSDALSYAHRHQVLHKDLKPGNLLLTHDGVLKVIDFGVACLVTAQDSAKAIFGTPVYMSPEQIRGEELDARTDIYSLGIILYELVTGAPPFPLDTSDLERLKKGVKDFSHLPEEWIPVMQKALAPDRRNRWDSVAEFTGALAEAQNSLFL